MVFRGGSPQSTESLHLIGVPFAKCVILMSLLEEPVASDALTLRVIIAITAVGLRPGAYVVAEAMMA